MNSGDSAVKVNKQWIQEVFNMGMAANRTKVYTDQIIKPSICHGIKRQNLFLS